MNRTLIHSSAFVRAARRVVKKNPTAAEQLSGTLELLEADAFHPSLKTHKLQGSLAGCYACSAGYDLRIVFQIVQHQNAEAILLLTVGSHDAVY